MGCFSFMCLESGEAVKSTCWEGDAVYLYLLRDGKVIEEMYGNYNSYGQVLDADGKSFEWDMPWGKVCDLMFSSNQGDGIAAIMERFHTGRIPTQRSEGDPDQGWGNGDWTKADGPYHKIIEEIKQKISLDIFVKISYIVIC